MVLLSASVSEAQVLERFTAQSFSGIKTCTVYLQTDSPEGKGNKETTALFMEFNQQGQTVLTKYFSETGAVTNETRFTYLDDGKLQTERRKILPGGEELLLSYHYDPEGRLIEVTAKEEQDEYVCKKFNYTSADSNIYVDVYDKSGAQTGQECHRKDGYLLWRTDAASGVRKEFVSDSSNNIVTVKVSKEKNGMNQGTITSKFENTYDGAGRLISVSTESGTQHISYNPDGLIADIEITSDNTARHYRAVYTR